MSQENGGEQYQCCDKEKGEGADDYSAFDGRVHRKGDAGFEALPPLASFIMCRLRYIVRLYP